MFLRTDLATEATVKTPVSVKDVAIHTHKNGAQQGCPLGPQNRHQKSQRRY